MPGSVRNFRNFHIIRVGKMSSNYNVAQLPVNVTLSYWSKGKEE